jgi:hypothetical protein
MVHRREVEGETLNFGIQGALWGNAMTWWDHESPTQTTCIRASRILDAMMRRAQAAPDNALAALPGDAGSGIR